MTQPTIVLLGPERATFTYGAYAQIAPIYGAPPLNGNVVAVARNRNVLETLQHTPNAFGLIAVETRVKGRVNESLEAFIKLGSQYNGDCPLRIMGAATIPLSFALMSRGCRIENIEGLLAHEQALAACAKPIEKFGGPVEDSISNGRAAQDVANVDRYARFAALGPIEAAEKYGLTVLDTSFEKGLTTFFLLSSEKGEVSIGRHNRALMVFRTKGGDGALVDALIPFKKNKINLIHIHSVHDTDGVYDFVVEAECDEPGLDRLHAAFKGLRKETIRCTTFGPFEVKKM